MKSFKEISKGMLSEGGEMYPADEMTMKEIKIACYAARNILERLEDGAMIQRWQISAIVKASDELASVYTSMSADEGMEDDDEYMMDDEHMMDDEDHMMDDEDEMGYDEYGYPSMYEAYSEDDIALGGSVIYKHGNKYLYAKANKKTGGGAGTIVHTTTGHKVPLHNVVSTDLSDWNSFKNKKVNEASDTHMTKDGRTAKKSLWYNINQRKKKGLSPKKPGDEGYPDTLNIDEAIEISHDRYMRSHGKKAKAGTGLWMFTHKRMGEVDYNNDKDVFEKNGKFSDVTKDAKAWAKKNGYSTVYVMEEVELYEVSDKKLDTYRQKAFADQPAGDDGSNKYRKRKTGRDLAFAKQTGRAKVLATKESTDLDEVFASDYKGMLGTFKRAVEKAEAAHKKGDDKAKADNIENARMRLRGMKNVDIAKLKNTDHYDRFKKLNEDMDYSVEIEGLPKMYVKGKSPMDVKAILRKIVKKPDMIQNVERTTKSQLRKAFMLKAQGKDEDEDV
jgi:hypothetical protein